MEKNQELGIIGKTLAFIWGGFWIFGLSSTISGIFFGGVIYFLEDVKKVKVEGILLKVIVISWGVVSVIIFIFIFYSDRKEEKIYQQKKEGRK